MASILLFIGTTELLLISGLALLLFGGKKHPESIGTISFCGNNCALIEEESEIIIQNSEFSIKTNAYQDKAIKVNYRPINGNEASFPSTHIFLTTFFMLSLHNLLTKVFKNNLVKYLSLCVAVFFIVIVTLFRVLSGMHYITDAMRGLFIGLTFYFLSFGIAKIFTNNKEE